MSVKKGKQIIKKNTKIEQKKKRIKDNTSNNNVVDLTNNNVIDLSNNNEEEEEEEEQQFRRILKENKKTKQLLLEWMDNTTSWCDRKHLKYQDCLEDWDNREEEGVEIRISTTELKEKVSILVKWLTEESTNPKKIIFHLGAGMSAGDGVPTFRGTGGLWTNNRVDISDFDLTKIQPGMQYRCLNALEKAGYIYWIITQNYDGLIRKSGYPSNKLSEIHGNIFIERCLNCNKEYYRDFPVEDENGDGEDHRTGRKCELCKDGVLIDVIVHFGESLRDDSIANAKAKEANISIAIGTKLMVTPASDWVFYPTKRKRFNSRRSSNDNNIGKVCVVNIQETPNDQHADIVIHQEATNFMMELCKQLNVDVPMTL
jgi:mono-ADP-ribosyltransferase sirtuin 6